MVVWGGGIVLYIHVLCVFMCMYMCVYMCVCVYSEEGGAVGVGGLDWYGGGGGLDWYGRGGVVCVLEYGQEWLFFKFVQMSVPW